MNLNPADLQVPALTTVQQPPVQERATAGGSVAAVDQQTTAADAEKTQQSTVVPKPSIGKGKEANQTLGSPTCDTGRGYLSGQFPPP